MAAAALLVLSVIAIPAVFLAAHLVAPTPTAEVVDDDGQVRAGGRSLRAAAEAVTGPKLRLVGQAPVATACQTHQPT